MDPEYITTESDWGFRAVIEAVYKDSMCAEYMGFNENDWNRCSLSVHDIIRCRENGAVYRIRNPRYDGGE